MTKINLANEIKSVDDFAKLKFSYDMKPGLLSGRTVTVQSKDGQTILGTVTYDELYKHVRGVTLKEHSFEKSHKAWEKLGTILQEGDANMAKFVGKKGATRKEGLVLGTKRLALKLKLFLRSMFKASHGVQLVDMRRDLGFTKDTLSKIPNRVLANFIKLSPQIKLDKEGLVESMPKELKDEMHLFREFSDEEKNKIVDKLVLHDIKIAKQVINGMFSKDKNNFSYINYVDDFITAAKILKFEKWGQLKESNKEFDDLMERFSKLKNTEKAKALDGLILKDFKVAKKIINILPEKDKKLVPLEVFIANNS